MGLSIYNTLSNKKEKFTPLEEGKVKLYLCGPTVYNYLHIGNFRGPIVFNLMRNWMEQIGYEVTFVYNYTDVDDKIIKKANEEGVESSVISERYIKAFEEDFKRLGLKAHDHNPKVTEYIPQIISYIEKLIEREKGYVVDGEVFYSVEAFSDYGKLSNNKLEDLNAGQRVEVDPRKKSAQDFVLWKPAKPGEPSWDSPWGKGRPGWHIECSAMIKSILGETIDIHGGGCDLIFPHHECEIAQGEGHTGKPYCNYWIHNNFINLNDEKMSKSLGNIILGRDFMDKYHPEILKYLFLSAHYRSILSVTDEKIKNAITALFRVYSAVELATQTVDIVEASSQADTGFNKKIEQFENKIKKSLNDDFNTADFISTVFEAVRAFNALGFASKKRNPVHKGASEAFLHFIKKYGQMSALFGSEPQSMLTQLEELLIRINDIDVVKVQELIKQRNIARESKDWSQADQLRQQLDDLGIEVFDGAQRGWRVKIRD